MISYVYGDATAPYGEGPRVVAHICNDAGKWGAGFVVALSRRWGEPEAVYRRWHDATLSQRTDYPLALGNTTLVYTSESIVVANMVAQQGLRSPMNPVPLRYDALRTCLRKVARYCTAHLHDGPTADRHPDAAPGKPVPVHMPRIGCGLAGGNWETVEPVISQELCSLGVPVTVYNLP